MPTGFHTRDSPRQRPDWSRRPASGEHDPYYAGYLARVPDGDLIGTLERDGASMLALLRSAPHEREEYRYAPDKWSIRELVGHCIDGERVFAYRALSFARGLPLLGGSVADAVAAGGLVLDELDGDPVLRYHDHVFPVAPAPLAPTASVAAKARRLRILCIPGSRPFPPAPALRRARNRHRRTRGSCRS